MNNEKMNLFLIVTVQYANNENLNMKHQKQ